MTGDHRDYDGRREKHRRRDRSRSRDRDRDRSRDRDREENDGYRRRERLQDRSREREDRYRSYSPRNRSPERHDREHSREHFSTLEHARESNMRTYARGGRAYEDNGGLPSLRQPDIEDRWAGFSHLPASYEHYASMEQQRQQHANHGGTSDRYQDAYSAYGANLEAGLEGDISAPAQPAAARGTSADRYGSEEGEDPYDFRAAAWPDEDYSDWAQRAGRSDRRRRRGWRDEPSATVYVRGVPEETEEADFYDLLSGFSGVRRVRITKDRSTGRSKGYAFVDFDSIESAMAVMESEAAVELQLMGQRLQMEYSVSPQPAHAAGSSDQGLSLDWICSMCQAINFSRRLECFQCCTARAADVQRVTAGLEGPSAVLKVSGIEPHTTEDVLHSLFAQHVAVREIRAVRDRYTGEPRGFCFVQFHTLADAARALQLLQNSPVEGQTSTLRLCYAKDRATASGPAADALQAAAAMSAYTGWAPKQYDESATDPASSAAVANSGQAEQATPDASAAASQASPGFVYDSISGYYHDSSSGCYYDANTGLYFVSESQKWLSLDPSTGQFYDPAQAPADAATQAAQNATAVPYTTDGHAHAAEQQSLGELQAPEAAYHIKKAPPKKRGAVIGSAPKLNTEGLLAAARAAQEKEERQKAQEAKEKAKAAAAAKRAQQQKQSHQVVQQQQPPSEGSQGVPAASAVPLPQGPVRGVIRSTGRWNKHS